MDSSRLCAVLAITGALLLSACSSQPAALPYKTTPIPVTPTPAASPAAAAYPGPQTPGAYPAPPTVTSSYPGPQEPPRTDSGRSQTVFESYQVALNWAKQNFGPDAQLYEVVPSRVMLSNLGNPPTALGWFYKFRAPSKQGSDLFVQVVNGQFALSRELSPLGEIPKAELPIDITKLSVDSTKAMELFAQRAPAKGVSVDSAETYDLQLINLQGTPGPVWGVLSPKDNTPILWLDASTGNDASNPNS